MAEESITLNNKCKKVNLLILGSFFIMQEVRTIFGYKEVRDIAIINYSGGKKIKNWLVCILTLYDTHVYIIIIINNRFNNLIKQLNYLNNYALIQLKAILLDLFIQ